MWFSVALCCTFSILVAAKDLPAEGSDKEFEDMTAPEIIKAHGYPVEEYTVTTRAGYILKIHRIPHGRKPAKSDDSCNKFPILLQHALLCSSDNWLLMGPEKGLGFVLADEGYDVWMPNTRGNKYSRQHVNLNDKEPEYWDFSWHEMGADDMPDVIDYILNATGRPKLMYAGHSQGTTSFWTFNIFNQNYTDKVSAMFALGPIAYMFHSHSPIFQLGGALEKVVPEVRSEFLPHEEIVNELGSKFCTDNQIATPEICSHLIFLLMGYDEPQTNMSNVHIVLAHTPAGQSFKQILHYCQGGLKPVFRLYDHGPVRNKIVYGQITPPDYDLSKVKIPVYLYYGPNDALGALPDVHRLEKELGNLKKSYEVPFKLFNHIDFLIAKDVDKLVYKELLTDMRNVCEEHNKGE